MGIPECIIPGDEVSEAVARGRPIVALESSVISQGLPRPKNLEAAVETEGVVRAAGAIPATVAVLDGTIRVGLTHGEIERLALRDGVEKAGARDLGRAVATGATMATTVGATLAIAHAAGIWVMATGGIGGVHRGVEQTGDTSHDLRALSTTSAIVVSAGFKSILDLPKTLEALETLGVPIVGWRTSSLPDFYGVDSGFTVPRACGAEEIATILMTQRDLGLATGVAVVNPPPEALAIPREQLAEMVSASVSDANHEHVRGKALTPYLLDRIAGASHGRSVDLNIALLLSNACVATEIATALAPCPR